MPEHPEATPKMATIHKRPTKVQEHLHSSDGVYVQCRLANGEDVHVPLSAILERFYQDMARKVRQNTAQ